MGAIVVTNEDGTKETLALRPVGIIAAERRWKGTAPAVEGSLYAAWFTSAHQSTDFDAWVASLADVEDEKKPEEPEGPADPTPPAEPPAE